MRRRAAKRAPIVIGIVLCCAFAASSGCGEENEPLADVTIEIQTTRYFPAEVHSLPGRPVRWVNRLSRASANERTVTSGTGPTDSEAGALFDELLVGFASGEEDDFVFRFEEPGEYPFFSRLPSGGEFTGVVMVP